MCPHTAGNCEIFDTDDLVYMPPPNRDRAHLKSWVDRHSVYGKRWCTPATEDPSDIFLYRWAIAGVHWVQRNGDWFSGGVRGDRVSLTCEGLLSPRGAAPTCQGLLTAGSGCNLEHWLNLSSPCERRELLEGQKIISPCGALAEFGIPL